MKKYLRNNMNLFSKIEWVKQLSTDAIGISDEVVIKRMLGRLYRKGTSQIKKYGILQLSQPELILDQLLKSNEVSPRSAYRWFLLAKAPKEVCELGREDKISQNEIQRRLQGVLQKSPEQDKLSKEIIQDIIKVVEVV